MRPAAVIILAAGAGTRMASPIPKMLHRVCGQAMIDHALAAARAVDPAELAVVVGHQREQVTAHLSEHAPGVQVVVQHHQGGTGHAVRVALGELGLGRGTVVVTYGDVPALRGSTLVALVAEHDARQAAVSAVTARLAVPTGYGRVIRGPGGELTEIVEDDDATPEQRAVTEVNSGVYAFEAALLAHALPWVGTGNAKGEQYLTDVVAIMRANGLRVASVQAEDAGEVSGVNDQIQLAQAQRILGGTRSARSA
jgi:bifunctional UDP-N-acetylglucosamine pyrophosphorylase / glucosamine-1-phosphate N-acetyltransferase